MSKSAKVKFENNIKATEKEIKASLLRAMQDLAELAGEHTWKQRGEMDYGSDNGGVPVFDALLKGSRNIRKSDEDTWTLEYVTDYAHAIEFGTGPRNVDPKDLVRWVHLKLRVPRTKEGKAMAFKIANAIAGNIQMNGQKAQPYLIPAVNFASTKKEEVIRRRLKKDGVA